MNDTVVRFDGIENEEDLIHMITTKEEKVIDAARIDGTYEDYVKLMEVTDVKKERVVRQEDHLLVIDSIDVAEHLKSKKVITSVISFSFSLLTPRWLNAGKVFSGPSLNILS